MYTPIEKEKIPRYIRTHVLPARCKKTITKRKKTLNELPAVSSTELGMGAFAKNCDILDETSFFLF